MSNEDNSRPPLPSRRDFLKTSTAAAVGTTLATNMTTIPGAYAAGSDMIRVGLIGFGGRGTGAIRDVLNADPGVKIVAVGALFKDRLEASRAEIRKLKAKFGDRSEVPDDYCFVGFDAYEKVLASDINYVILATPPAFRPTHLKAAVAAGKHIFTEKPVATDATGIRTVLASYEEAKAKGLHIAAGTQRRHQTGYLETMKRVHGGDIGQVVAAQCYWNQAGLWVKPRQKEWSDMEWQVRNWLYFTWLSGDHIVEQHVHNLDVVNWAIGSHPISAYGMGGRQARTDPAYGHIYDHFTIDYEYEGGVHIMSQCRQIDNTDKKVAESLTGTKGMAFTEAGSRRYMITGEKSWRFRDKDNAPYVQEHMDLIASIRKGQPLNELKSVAESTLTAIMGRMSAYTGKKVTWEQALNSKENLVPAKLAFGEMPVPPVAIPGRTELV